MLKLVVIGAGSHSRLNHLPALAHYAREHPGEIALAALCDLDAGLASAMAAQFGFARTYTNYREMLRAERPDGCVAVTPIPVTAQVARQVMAAGIPLCMEKPPGATPDEAREVAELAERTDAHVMVSVNRRFDPALTAAMNWWGDGPMEVVRGCMARVDRRETFFMTGTAIHMVDAMRFMAGEVRDFAVEGRRVDGVRWFLARLIFGSGATGILEVMPTAGADAEVYEISGPGRRAICTSGYKDRGSYQCWAGGELALQSTSAAGVPEFLRAGTYAETCAFIAALREGIAPHPTPAEVLPSLELCHALDAAFPL